MGGWKPSVEICPRFTEEHPTVKMCVFLASNIQKQAGFFPNSFFSQTHPMSFALLHFNLQLLFFGSAGLQLKRPSAGTVGNGYLSRRLHVLGREERGGKQEIPVWVTVSFDGTSETVFLIRPRPTPQRAQFDPSQSYLDLAGRLIVSKLIEDINLFFSQEAAQEWGRGAELSWSFEDEGQLEREGWQ